MTSLGVDLGTGSIKVAVVSREAKVLSRSSKAYPITSPLPGWAESEPADWLNACREAADEALRGFDETPEHVGFSGQMHGVVVTDASLQPLRPAILWADTRSAGEAQRMNDELGSEQMSRLGSGAVAGFAATTLAWLARHEPEVMAKAHHVLQPKDWLRAALGGHIATEPSDASGTLLYDVSSGEWSETAVAWAGFNQELLPAVEWSHRAAGEISLNGLRLPCAVGGADTACALLGLGLGPGDGFVAVGSGAQVVSVMNTATLDPSLATHTFSRAGDARFGWYRIGAVQNGGLALEPTLSMLGSTFDEAHEALQEGVTAHDPVFVPYLAGERTPFMDPHLRGSWHNISLGTTRSMMLRSALEGVAHAVALAIDAVGDAGGKLPEVLPLIGGGGANPIFRQLLADCTNWSLANVEAPDAAVTGAALLGSGLYENPTTLQHSGVTHPRADQAALLSQRRSEFVSLVEKSATSS